MSDCLNCRHLHLPIDGGCDAYTVIPHDIVSSEQGHDRPRGDEDKAKVAFAPRIPSVSAAAALPHLLPRRAPAAHLTGRHDQKKHGRGLGGGRAGMGDIPLSDRWVQKMQGGSAAGHIVRRADGSNGFTPERQALHDAAIADALAGKTEVPNPRMLVLGGGPASGKSAYLRSEAGAAFRDPNTVTANFDEMKARLPEYTTRIALGDQAAAAFTHAESSYMSSRLQAAAMENRFNLTADSTGDGGPGEMRAKIRTAKAAGYRVDGRYLTLDTDAAIASAVRREAGSGPSGGRHIPPPIIREVHRNVSATVPDVYTEFDSFELYDNTRGAEHRVLGYHEGATVIDDPAGWDTFVAKGAGVEF